MFGVSQKVVKNLFHCIQQNEVNSCVNLGFKRSFRHINYSNNGRAVGIIGAPFEKGQRKHGVSLGPEYIRKTGFINKLKRNGLAVKDYGDIAYTPYDDLPKSPYLRELDHVASYTENLSSAVAEVIKDNRMCITLGGDHSIGVGTLHGHSLARPDIAVIWIDAHADMNTEHTTYTGNIHGMAVPFNIEGLSEYCPRLPGMTHWLNPSIPAKNIAFIGLRDVDPYEKLIINKLEMTAFSMDEVDELGIKEIIKRTLHAIDPEGIRSLHISFDIDSLDILEAPSTGTAVSGGLTLREGIRLVENIQATGRLNGFDLVEVNPMIGSLADQQKTLAAASHLFLAACGIYRGGVLPLNVEDIPKSRREENII